MINKLAGVLLHFVIDPRLGADGTFLVDHEAQRRAYRERFGFNPVQDSPAAFTLYAGSNRAKEAAIGRLRAELTGEGGE